MSVATKSKPKKPIEHPVLTRLWLSRQFWLEKSMEQIVEESGISYDKIYRFAKKRRLLVHCKPWLETEIITHRKKSKQIADEQNCSVYTLYRSRRKFSLRNKDLIANGLAWWESEPKPKCKIGGPRKFLQLYDKKWLEKEYAEGSAPKIAAKVGCSKWNVGLVMRKLGIPIDPDKITLRVSRIDNPVLFNDDDWMILQYETKQRTMVSIAKEVGTGDCNIRNRLVALGLTIDKNRGQAKSIYPKLHDREWLYQKYIVEKLSTTKIAKLLKIKGTSGRISVAKRLGKYGIYKQKQAEAVV